MDLAEIIGLGVAASAAVYMKVDYERRVRIDSLTDGLIADSCYRRNNYLPLKLPPKESFTVLGLDTYRAVRRYNQVYDALQEKGDTTDSRELTKLFEMK